MMKKSWGLSALGVVVALGVLGSATTSFGQAATTVNPVQREMRLLRDAMRAAVDAIAAGDVRELPAQLHAVHVAAGDTRASLEKGEYVLPSHADQIDSFVALDEAFHHLLIKMVKAARRNDVSETANVFGDLMTRCHACHEQYGVQPTIVE
jgi:cytochrome c556